MTDHVWDGVPLGDHLVVFNGETYKIKDVPDPFIRTMLGYGHEDRDKRAVIAVEGRTWETTPDVCTYGSLNGDWVMGVAEGHHALMSYLVCPKCGLDGT